MSQLLFFYIPKLISKSIDLLQFAHQSVTTQVIGDDAALRIKQDV